MKQQSFNWNKKATRILVFDLTVSLSNSPFFIQTLSFFLIKGKKTRCKSTISNFKHYSPNYALNIFNENDSINLANMSMPEKKFIFMTNKSNS